MGVPAPGETALLAAAVLAHQADLSLPVVIAVAAIVGDNVGSLRDRLEQAARDLLTSEGWQRWIRVRATNGLGRYSPAYLEPPRR